jgi:hypothetical protein
MGKHPLANLCRNVVLRQCSHSHTRAKQKMSNIAHSYASMGEKLFMCWGNLINRPSVALLRVIAAICVETESKRTQK